MVKRRLAGRKISCAKSDLRGLCACGGRGRDRTGDPLLAKQVLSQLSYTPTAEVTLILKHFRTRRNPFLRILVKTVPKLFQNPRLQRQVLGIAEPFDWLGG